MTKTIVSLVALGALLGVTPALAQQAPAASPEIPRGVFLRQQPSDVYLARNTVLFAKVRDANGKIIGDVEDLLINDRNEVVGVLMGVGGFLGAGEKRIAVRLSALEVEEKNGKTIVTLRPATKEVLKALEPFKRNRPPKSMIERIKERAQELTDKAVETSSEAAHQAREQAGPAFDKAKEAAGKAYERTKEAVGGAVDKAKEAAQPAPKQ
jgi:hypothetical protein